MAGPTFSSGVPRFSNSKIAWANWASLRNIALIRAFVLDHRRRSSRCPTKNQVHITNIPATNQVIWISTGIATRLDRRMYLGSIMNTLGINRAISTRTAIETSQTKNGRGARPMKTLAFRSARDACPARSSAIG